MSNNQNFASKSKKGYPKTVSFFWFKNARYQALPQSVLPALLAVALCVHNGQFSIIMAILAVIGVASAHLGMNLFDDYFDFTKKSSDHRNNLERKGIRARLAKCEYLLNQSATVSQLFRVSLYFCLFALLIGLILLYVQGVYILVFMLILVVMGISYSAPPLRLSYHGLGELTLGFIFGPLLMLGVAFACTGEFVDTVLWISIPMGFLVCNILFSHSIMDFEPDKEVGKMTLAVILKKTSWMLGVSFLFNFLPFLIIIGGVCIGQLSIYYLLVLLILYMPIYLFFLMVKFVKDPFQQFEKKWWMGNMETWNEVKASGIDWFMIRWYLSRNILTFFALIIIILSILNV